MVSARPAFPTEFTFDFALRGLRQVARRLGLRRPRILRGERVESPLVVQRVDTARLVLDRHRMSNAAQWFAIQSSQEVILGLHWPVRDRRQSRRHLRDRTRHTVLAQADDFLAYAVMYGGALIGDVSLHLRDVSTATRSVEIGWVLNPDYTRRGFGSEATSAVLALAFQRLDAREVFAEIDPANLRSRALATRLGFRKVAANRYSVTRHEWERRLPGAH